MSSKVANDVGVGRAFFTTRLHLTLHAIRMCLMMGALPGLLLPLSIWSYWVTPQQLDIVRAALISEMQSSSHRMTYFIRDAEGAYRFLVAHDASGASSRSLLPSELRETLSSEWQAYRTFQTVLLFAPFTGLLGFMGFWWLLSAVGLRASSGKRLRGAMEWVKADKLDQLVREREGGGTYNLAEVCLPRVAPTAGILCDGAQGTGKSLVIHDLMHQVFAKKRKAIIYDQSGEFFRAYYRPNKDFFFNPSIQGSVPWSIFSELHYIYDASTLAQAFLPPKAGVVHGASAFFEDAARSLFSVMLQRLGEKGAINTQDIAKAILEMPEDEMASLIEKSTASSAIGGDSKGQRQGVISSISIYLEGLLAVQPGGWSVRDFLEAEDDARLFLLGTDDTKAMFTPLFRVLLSSAFAMIASKQELVHGDKFWFFIDEAPTLGDIKLDEALASLRKFGVCIVAGIQSESQFAGIVGKDRAETIMNCFNTILSLRQNDSNSMERAAKRLGKLEVVVVQQNQALAVAESRDGANLGSVEREKWLIMPAEIGQLDTCTGFLKVPGTYPVAKVDYSHWLQGRVKDFAPVQKNPPRDPRFELLREWDPGTVNPLEMAAQAHAAKLKSEIKKTDSPVTTGSFSGTENNIGKTDQEQVDGKSFNVDVGKINEIQTQRQSLANDESTPRQKNIEGIVQ